MIKNTTIENKSVEEIVDFDYLVKTIHNAIKTVKVFKVHQAISTTKGMGMLNTTIWNNETIKATMYNNYIIIEDGENTVSMNKDINLIIRKDGIENTRLELFLIDHNTILNFQY